MTTLTRAVYIWFILRNQCDLTGYYPEATLNSMADENIHAIAGRIETELRVLTKK